MAIRSPLNPGVIAPERKATPQKLQNFISGGAPLGSSVFTAAANNIVGFTRGAAVAPRQPNLGSIIQTLSSSILSNVESKVQNINQTVNQIVNERIGDLTKGYREKIASIDTSLPNKLLNSFLGLYEKALGYIQFFANRKNVATLGENLKALQDVFSETFRVAKIIRQQIVRIVDQLSNLPTASAGSGPGLSLDVNVPGGGLKRSAPTGLMRMMRRRPGLMLGGAATLGAGGAMVTSALAGPGAVEGEVTQSDAGLTGPYLDRFNAILNKFNDAINSLTSKKSPQQSGGGGGGATTAKPTSPGQPGGGSGASPGTASDVTADTKEETAWLQTLRKVEGTAGAGGYGKVFGGQVVKELEEGKLTVEEAARMSETGKLPDRLGGKQIAYGKYGGRVSGATGAYQFMPDTLRAAARRAGVDLNAPMTPEVQDQLALAHLRAIGIDPTKVATEATIRKAGGSAGWAGVHGEATGQTSRTVKESLAIYNQFYGSAAPTAKAAPPKSMSTVMAAATQASSQQQVAQQVAQPPTTIQTSDVNVMPMNMSGEGGGQVQTVDSGTIQGGTIPFLLATNEDNFLTLYSKMVYNIVDG